MQTNTNHENIRFSFEAMGNSSYLVATFHNELLPINYQVEMLRANEIYNILPANKHQKNADIQMYYNVTSKISLSQAVGRKKMSKDNFINLILGAVNAFKEVDEYQLVNTGIIFDPELIFVKMGTFEPAFVYLPVYTVDEGLMRLREFIVSLILKDVIEVSNDNFVQILLSRLNSDTVSLAELARLLNELKSSAPLIGYKINNPLPLAVEPINISTPLVTKPEPIINNLSNISTEPSYKKIFMLGLQVLFLIGIIGLASSGGLKSDTGDIDPAKVVGVLIAVSGIDFVLYRELFINKAVVLPRPQPSIEATSQAMQPVRTPMMNIAMAAGSDDTVPLTDNNKGSAYLDFFENGISNKIALDKPSVLLGRLKGQVDYIFNNNKVGKIHAEFICQDGYFFVKDYNSTNGTYINGSQQRITSNVKYQIYNNDRISLANSELILKC